jgi:hypothetical protein
MKSLVKVGLGCLALTCVVAGFGSPATADTAAKITASGALTTLAAPPTDEGKIALLIAGQEKPVTVTLSQDTTLGGICIDCLLYLTFKPGESPKNCAVCGCAVSNAQCIAWTKLKSATWQDMFKALPKGAALRAVYNTPDKPESGLKTLLVDRRTVLLPVEGLNGQTPEQLLPLVKPFGGTKAELQAEGKQLVIHLKDDWSVEKEAKFEKALEKAGGKIVPVAPAPEPSDQAAH